MALAALIFAEREIEDGSGMIRGALPLAGATLIEHQVRRAIRAGAGHIVILVERLPAALVNAIDRLRRDGMRIDIARGVEDAAGRFHPDENVILVADGCMAPAGSFDRLVSVPAPALATLPDQPELEEFERIDAVSRWAGLALVDGRILQETAARLGEWDFELTLLRRALQQGATMVPAIAPGNEANDIERPFFARRAADLDFFERQLIDGSAGFREGWPARYIFPLIEPIGFARLVRGKADPWWLGIAAVLSAAVGIMLVALGWYGAALAMLVLSGPLASIARRLADVRIKRLRHAHWLEIARLAAAGTTLIAFGVRRSDDGQWGWSLLAIVIAGVMIALALEWQTARKLDNRATMPFMATADGLIWLMIPFALFGAWGVGMMASALYAIASFVAAQRLVHDAIVAKLRAQPPA